AADVFVNTPQTVSIALGAMLVAFVDYRALVITMAIVVIACSVYLLTRRRAHAPAPRSAEAV
ncbi:MAG TPA: hypothetical protein VE736_07375, partial [Gaiellaceae bacterium]|nr:hypothetical protein [Gaiellaceae bacterium]